MYRGWVVVCLVLTGCGSSRLPAEFVRFTSHRFAYSIGYPASWHVRPATGTQGDEFSPTSSPHGSHVVVDGERFAGSSSSYHARIEAELSPTVAAESRIRIGRYHGWLLQVHLGRPRVSFDEIAILVAHGTGWQISFRAHPPSDRARYEATYRKMLDTFEASEKHPDPGLPAS